MQILQPENWVDTFPYKFGTFVLDDVVDMIIHKYSSFIEDPSYMYIAPRMAYWVSFCIFKVILHEWIRSTPFFL